MTVSIKIVRTLEEFARLRPEWDSLLGSSGIRSPFLTWEWMFTWWQHYCEGSDDRDLAIVVGRMNDELVAILPGYIQRRKALGLSVFRFLGTEYESTDYLQTIESIGCRPTLLASMLAFLTREGPRPDILYLSGILEASPTLNTLESFAHSARCSYETSLYKVCPFIPISGDWEEYLSQLSSKMRKNVRRAGRQLQDAGAQFDFVRERDEVRPAVRELFALHARRFASKNVSTRFSADLREPFHAEVSELFFDRGILRLFRVILDGRTIGSVYCFEYGRELSYFQSGIDPASDRLSVGTALVAHAIKYAFDRRLSLFDFMRGDEAYKFRWTQTTRSLVAVYIGVSWRGRAALAVRRQGSRAKYLLKRIAGARQQPTKDDLDAA